jgi:FtsP/CotA-like multicopper oxidase with cupredoxin domain
VPDLPQPLLKPGETFDYAFPLNTPGTHWMHAHTLQEQQLLAAPLIVADPAEAGLDEQEVVVLLHDFSFRGPGGATGRARRNDRRLAWPATGHAMALTASAAGRT